MMPVVLMMMLVLSSLVLLITVRSHLHKKYPVSDSLISNRGIVDAPLAPKGSVIINGELWMARSANNSTIPAKTKVKVIGFEDHLLLVTPA
jgi:membrane-bound ClpP family serine protease